MLLVPRTTLLLLSTSHFTCWGMEHAGGAQRFPAHSSAGFILRIPTSNYPASPRENRTVTTNSPQSSQRCSNHWAPVHTLSSPWEFSAWELQQTRPLHGLGRTWLSANRIFPNISLSRSQLISMVVLLGLSSPASREKKEAELSSFLLRQWFFFCKMFELLVVL